MDVSFDERLIAYRLAMSLAAVMLHRDIISSSEYVFSCFKRTKKRPPKHRF